MQGDIIVQLIFLKKSSYFQRPQSNDSEIELHNCP
jgi:hypothetical protein